MHTAATCRHCCAGLTAVALLPYILLSGLLLGCVPGPASLLACSCLECLACSACAARLFCLLCTMWLLLCMWPGAKLYHHSTLGVQHAYNCSCCCCSHGP